MTASLPVATLVDLLADRSAQGLPPALVVAGAGVSVPAIPSADNIKRGLLSELVNRAYPFDLTTREKITGKLKRDNTRLGAYLTLELLMFSCEYAIDGIEKGKTSTPKSKNSFDIEGIIHGLMPRWQYAPGNHSIALMRRANWVGPILTANFDTLLTDTLDAAGAGWTLKTTLQLPGNGEPPVFEESDILAFHGTLVEDTGNSVAGPRAFASPGTLVARGLMRPFEIGVSNYLTAMFDRAISESRPIIFFGYSGSDFYDMNLLLGSFMASSPSRRGLARLIHIVRHDPNGSGDLSPFIWGELVGKGNAQVYASADVNVRFGNLVQKRLGYLASKSSIESEFRRAAANAGLPDVPVAARWPDLLVDVSESDAQRAIDLITEGLPGAWAVTEHYTLESFGFDQDQIQLLAGVIEQVRLGGKDLRVFIEAQGAYWRQRGSAGQTLFSPLGD